MPCYKSACFRYEKSIMKFCTLCLMQHYACTLLCCAKGLSNSRFLLLKVGYDPTLQDERDELTVNMGNAAAAELRQVSYGTCTWDV